MKQSPSKSQSTSHQTARAASVAKQPGKVAIVVGIGIVIVGLAITALWAVWRDHTPTANGSSAPARTMHVTTAVVAITSSGFVPATVSVHAPTNVVWVNQDTLLHLPAADPYPTHASLPGLAASSPLGHEETYSFLFTKPTTVHYHDDLHPELTGTIEVK